MGTYRQLLGLPGVRTLMLVMFFARLPISTAPVVVTLHVAVGMGLGYGQAGLVGASSTIGIALGAPIMGRVIDRFGLRPMLVMVTIVETSYWALARFASYETLLVIAFFGGFFIVPAMSIGRQAIPALVPEAVRRTAFSLDSVSTEFSFMTGPIVGVAIATQLSTRAALTAMAITVLAVGVLLFVINPKVRADHEIAAGTDRVPRREWLTPQLLGVYAVGAGAIFMLAGVDVSVVAALRESGQVGWTGVVTAIMCVASASAGVVYGLLKRPVSLTGLVMVMGLLVLPVGWAGDQWWLLGLALVPATALCAPGLALVNEQVNALAPATMRGVATGLQSSGFTLGAAAGVPLAGFVIDHTSAAWGFVAAGVGGIAVALGASLTQRTHEKVNVGSPQ